MKCLGSKRLTPMADESIQTRSESLSVCGDEESDVSVALDT
jgi:hypothetical protein